MKLIIAGSRTAKYHQVLNGIKLARKIWNITAIISGCARGADLWGEVYAQDKKILLIRMPAEWDEYGKYAGPIRNREMAKEGDVLLAIWDGASKGTHNMIQEAIKAGIPVIVYPMESRDLGYCLSYEKQ